MPRAKTTTEKADTSSVKTDLLERFVPILLILSVGLAFLVGILWQKVTNLEGGGGAAPGQAANAVPLGAPTGPKIDVASIKGYAGELGLNTGDFESCLDGGKYQQKVADETAYGGTIGINGTPGFFLNGHLIEGAQPYSVFKDAIEYELKGANWDAPEEAYKYLVDANPQNGEIGKAKVNVTLGDSPVLGNASAPVTLVEFSDFECPFCASFYTAALTQLKTEYVDSGKVKFIYKNFPLNNIHPQAQKAAEAGLCANDQGKFWEMHDKLFQSHGA